MDRLMHDGYVVNTTALEGSNFLAAHITQEAFRAMCGCELDVLEILPGHPEEEIQAIAVTRRPGPERRRS